MSALIFILIIALLFWYCWYLLSAKNHDSNEEIADHTEMTETQRRWHANKAREQLEHILPDDVLDKYTKLDTAQQQSLQKLTKMQRYIVDHKRSFKFSEWLFWNIELRFIKKYCYWAILYSIGCWLLTLWGWDLYLSFSLLSWLYVDIMLYKQKLMLEVTTWNSEWNEKFGEKYK